MRFQGFSRTFLFALALLLFLPALESAADADSAEAYRQGYNLILDENWQGAITAFDALFKRDPASDWVDDAAFWRCYAQERLGKAAEEIFGCYEKFLDRYPASDWEDDARRIMVRLAKELDRAGRSEYREKVRDFGEDEDADRLLGILVALGEIGDERSVHAILERIDSTEDDHLRARMVGALEDVESEAALHKLQQLMTNDSSEKVRVAALEALGDHDSFDAVPLLRKIVNDKAQPVRLRLVALDELSDQEPPGLLHFLKEIALGPNDELALEAIDELDDIESEEAVLALVEILGETGDFERRAEAVDSLEDFEYESAAQALLKIAQSDPDPRLRREATESLGDMDTPAAREALIELLKSVDR